MKYAIAEENTESLLNYTKSLLFSLYLAYVFNDTHPELRKQDTLVNEWL
jgi:hypothetical protein